MKLKSFLICVSMYGMLLLIQYNSDSHTLDDYKKAHANAETTSPSPVKQITNSDIESKAHAEQLF